MSLASLAAICGIWADRCSPGVPRSRWGRGGAHARSRHGGGGAEQRLRRRGRGDARLEGVLASGRELGDGGGRPDGIRAGETRAKRLGGDVPAPRLTVTRAGAGAVLRYRFARLGTRTATRPTTLLVSVMQPGEPDRASALRVRVRGREGVVPLRLPPASRAPYVVSVSAFTQRGSRSRIVRATLR